MVEALWFAKPQLGRCDGDGMDVVGFQPGFDGRVVGQGVAESAWSTI